jgi:hypothetical protein
MLAGLLSVAAFLVLVAVLVIYKPRGLTRYGWRKQQQRALSQS